ncbi:hypothetical protein FRC01_001651 [Tulasnella sp. 417]|nr:hypothetical protein FRC01_001651 [Tulasnella sp. 417]
MVLGEDLVSLADEPTEYQWNRYDAYADRVRTIKFHDNTYVGGQRSKAITAELISALVKLHPRSAFCPPKLRKVVWTSVRSESVLAMAPFLCSTLEELDLALYGGSEVARELIEQAAGRTPRLKSLHLDMSGGLQGPLVLWLSRTPLLESLSLPTNYQTTGMVRALGGLVNLKQLKLDYEIDWEDERATQSFSFNPPPAFPRLESLDIGAPLDRLVQVFQIPEQFRQLKEVVLSSDDPIPEQVFNLTTAVAQRCPRITSITLEFYFSQENRICSLSFRHIRPLLACCRLKILKIEISSPFSIREQDLEDMARAWPEIQELNLASKPDEETAQGGFPLRLLPIAAGLFPKLQTLGIFIDPNGHAVGFDHNILPSAEFQSLQVLDIGTSRVPSNGPVALGFIIGALCKLEIKIVGDFKPLAPYCSEDDLDWSRVQDVVTALVKSKRAIHRDWTVTRKLQTARF